MEWHNGVWMRRIASGVTLLVQLLAILMLVMAWDDVYDAYYDPAYPIGMAEGGWRYRTPYHKLISAVVISAMILFSCALLIGARVKKPFLRLALAISLPFIIATYISLDEGGEYLGSSLMQLIEWIR